MSGKREYGDYQTPIDFAEKVCLYLKNVRHIQPSAVVEPTCGVGNFLKSSLIFGANEYYGIEINPEYCSLCKEDLNNKKVKILQADYFSFSSRALIQDSRQILVIGNPPWVTNSALSALGSDNLPSKVNFKGLRGIDAITGSSNFDICEYIILRLISEYSRSNTVISMLCKTTVARNVFKELKRNHVCFSSCDILEFNAEKVFGINVSACVLIIQLSENIVSSDVCNIFDFENAERVKSKLEYSNGHLYSNSGNHTKTFDGICCFEWRQGIKHDCSTVMELTLQNDTYHNRQNEPVLIEDEIVFPLVKSSMLKAPVIHSFSKFVIVTQKKIHEDTEHIKLELPKTWKYLKDHIDLFEKRKSSIYHGMPSFSMFGVGDYAYSKYKVAVSGFYKKPLFSVLYSDNHKPVMVDDTCYYISFDDYGTAYVAMLLLNSERVRSFLTNIAFLDAKRPYTKKVLERLDFCKIANSLTIEELRQVENEYRLSPFVTEPMYERFQSLLKMGQMRFL